MRITPMLESQKLNTSVVLNILCMAEAELDDSWQGDNYSLPFNRVYLVEEGSGLLGIDEHEVPMKQGMAYLVPAGVPLRYRCDGYMKKIYLHFNLLRQDRYDLLDGFHRIGVAQLPPDFSEKMRIYGARNNAEAVLKIRQLLYDLLGSLLEQFDLQKKDLPDYSEHVKNTIAYIQENLSAGLRVEDLAKRLFISRSSLATKFRSEVGVSIGKYIDDQLMMAALLRISRTQDSIQNISRELGFSDQCYFARRFKKVHGVTPTEHRRRKLV